MRKFLIAGLVLLGIACLVSGPGYAGEIPLPKVTGGVLINMISLSSRRCTRRGSSWELSSLRSFRPGRRVESVSPCRSVCKLTVRGGLSGSGTAIR